MTRQPPHRVSWKGITAGQSPIRHHSGARQKHALTCGDATPKIASYPPRLTSPRGRQGFFSARENFRGVG